MTTKSKILTGKTRNQNQTVSKQTQLVRDHYSSYIETINEEEARKKKEQRKISNDKRKEKIKQNAIDNMLANKIVQENKTKETALAEFAAMNAAAQKAVLTPFYIVKSKSRKNAGEAMSSSSKQAAMDDDTDTSTAETDNSNIESEAESQCSEAETQFFVENSLD
jgi:hypothetical protein